MSVFDRHGDARILRTDHDADGAFDPALHRLPDLIEIRIGTFAPVDPHEDPFEGAWDADGGFFRLDMVLGGLINPPGPLGFDDDDPDYEPFRYGLNPIFGFIEFDLDADPDTGGELEFPQLRYTGNVARFGGMPSESRFTGRVALDYTAFDDDVTTPPFIDRSGEEFHISFFGDEIEEVEVLVEKPGGEEGLFEEGEVWLLECELFHRAHGFSRFAFMCIEHPGRYEPEVLLLFAHDPDDDLTTVSLVYPLTNEASAQMEDDEDPVEENNGCDNDQNSIEEALFDLWFSATYADPLDRLLPEFELIAGWEFNDPADHLDPALWTLTALLGSAYETLEPDNARFVWTDAHPDPRVGDFDGSGTLDEDDLATLDDYIAAHDGDPAYDDDGSGNNGILDLHDFAENFALFDTGYDGVVEAADAVVPGDMDLNLVVDLDDVDDFVLALLDPDAYGETHGGADPLARGDLDNDGLLDGRDIAGLLNLIIDS